jgi:hypothetical protein
MFCTLREVGILLFKKGAGTLDAMGNSAGQWDDSEPALLARF